MFTFMFMFNVMFKRTEENTGNHLPVTPEVIHHYITLHHYCKSESDFDVCTAKHMLCR